VTFLAAARPAPPPPPPAPAAKPEPTKPKVVKPPRPQPETLVQPKGQPDEPPPPKEDPEPSEEGGLDGVEGGEPGATGAGVVGAVAPEPPPTPVAPKPAAELPPVMVPPAIGNAQRITDVSDPRFRPSLPHQLNHSGMMLWGLFRVCIGVDGNVKDVKVVKPADPLVDAEWTRVIHLWQYRPYSVDGRAVPFCHVVRVEVRGAP
jgi:hypothetical protein